MSTENSNPDKNEPNHAVPFPSSNKQPAYYIPCITPTISPEIHNFLRTYSHIPAASFPSHVQRIRDEAWAIQQFPCIGVGAYLQPPLLQRHEFYPSLLEHLTTDEHALFIDLGCFLAVDLRFLWVDLMATAINEKSSSSSSSNPNTSPTPTIHPESLSSKLKAIDLESSFWSLGHTFFADSPASFPIQFIQANALNPKEEDTPNSQQHTSSPLSAFRHKVSVLNIAQVLHQFPLSGQIAACKTIVEFYSFAPPRADVSASASAGRGTDSSSATATPTATAPGAGTVVIGNQIGNPNPRHASIGHGEKYFHSVESWTAMWEEVSKVTGTRWVVTADLKSFAECGHDRYQTGFLGEGARFLVWMCRRLG